MPPVPRLPTSKASCSPRRTANTAFMMSLRNTLYCYLEDTARDKMQIEAPEDQPSDNESAEIPHPDNDQYWEDYH